MLLAQATPLSGVRNIPISLIQHPQLLLTPALLKHQRVCVGVPLVPWRPEGSKICSEQGKPEEPAGSPQVWCRKWKEAPLSGAAQVRLAKLCHASVPVKHWTRLSRAVAESPSLQGFNDGALRDTISWWTWQCWINGWAQWFQRSFPTWTFLWFCSSSGKNWFGGVQDVWSSQCIFSPLKEAMAEPSHEAWN